tara:strand:- start:2222 stop:2887 length:666 start_codon:yes stop_codon:yes gene_type:complete
MPLDIKSKIQGVIFDLDGVIVDTAKFHFNSWKTIASEWNYELKYNDNEKLKGVSRMDCVVKIAGWAEINLSSEELERAANRKNEIYTELCSKLTPEHILPGIISLINQLKANDIRIALGSASKNARLVLKKLGLLTLFDVIVDGNDVSKSKPNPEVFIKAAKQMDLLPKNCVVLEDAPAGIIAALSANMKVIGVGNSNELRTANLVIENSKKLSIELLNQI